MRLVAKVCALSHGNVGKEVRKRMRTFKVLGRSSDDAIFKELCFCLLTANYSAEGGIRVQKAIGGGFLTLSRSQLARRLKKLGYRFPNKRAEYIVKARKHIIELRHILAYHSSQHIRKWLADNVHGLGYKEASHFLRNIGRSDVAIIDFHILDLLSREKIIRRPARRTLTTKKYIEIEKKLNRLSVDCDIALGALDLYLWYLETGKILK